MSIVQSPSRYRHPLYLSHTWKARSLKPAPIPLLPFPKLPVTTSWQPCQQHYSSFDKSAASVAFFHIGSHQGPYWSLAREDTRLFQRELLLISWLYFIFCGEHSVWGFFPQVYWSHVSIHSCSVLSCPSFCYCLKKKNKQSGLSAVVQLFQHTHSLWKRLTPQFWYSLKKALLKVFGAHHTICTSVL